MSQTQQTPVRPLARRGVTLSGPSGEVTLDATLSQSTSDTWDLAEHPIEANSPSGDHIIPKPLTLSLSGTFTATPLADEPAPERERRLYQDLLAMAAARELIEVRTRLRTFEAMAIERVELPREAGSGQALQVQVELRQVQVTQSQLVELPPRVRRRAPQPPEGKGDQPAKEPEGATKKAAQEESVLYGLTN